MAEIYLSRLWLNPRNPDVRRDVGDCHNLHRTILKAFPQNENEEKKARDEFNVLYRMDVDRRRSGISLLVQSCIKPDWSKLPDGYLLTDTVEENPSCKPLHETYSELKDGQRLRFRLRANPTRRLNEKLNGKDTDSKKRGKRVDIRDESEQIKWLKRKGEACGFQLVHLRLNADISNVHAGHEEKIEGRKIVSDEKSQTNRMRLTFGSVLFDGELVITNAEQFRQTLIDGIGSGKAYGFGLLSIARA